MNKDIYFISDPHISVRKPLVRTETTEEEWVEYQRNIFLQVKEIVGDSLLVITGDLIDTGTPFGTQTIVNMYADNTPKNTVFISGNHPLHGFSGDLELALKKGTLGNLVRIEGLKYLSDGTTYEWGDYVLHPFNYRYKRTLEHRKVDDTKINVALGHFLSYEKEVPPFIKNPASSAPDIIEEFPEYDLMVIGDNHSTFTVGNKYLSPGSLIRRTVNQTKHKPCVWKYDGENLTPIYLKVPSAEECITLEYKINRDQKTKEMHEWAKDAHKRMNEVTSTGDFTEDIKEYPSENDKEEQAVTELLRIVREIKQENN